ncbi:MAG: VOC family protein [Planctomycetes bacterium]|jgi:glyoxylase I family protein|nr:VOC family protein [Planctomycetota bacterium]
MPNTNLQLGGGGFHHVAIRSRDFDASFSFYRDVLGFVPTVAWGQAPGRAVMLDTGDGNYLEIFERPDQPPPPADQEGVILHFAIRTDDTDAALARARAAGVTVTMEPTDVDLPNTCEARPSLLPVRIAFFQGPDGEVIELFQNELT